MLKCEVPTNVSEICSFLGMAGYYRRFVEGFSIIAGPLTRLLKKDVQWCRDDQCQRSFDELKWQLTSAPVLTIPSGKGGFVMYSDASYQGQHNKVIAYASR